MIAIILTKKILSLVIILLMGVLLVKAKLLKSDDSKVISTLALYLVTPCSLLNAFQVDYSPEIRDGLLVAFLAAIVLHVFLLILNALIKRLLHLDEIEQLSLIYSNAGNLVIPLVSSILGSQWVIYSCAFMTIQQLLLWSHGKAVLCGERKPDFVKVITNTNILAIILGLIMFIFQIKLPSMLHDSVSQVGSMIGPCAMIVTGMLMADMDLKKVLSGKRLWMTAVLRLILVPVCALVIIRFSGMMSLSSNASTVLLISLIATITPSACSITNMAQVYGKNASYASAINMATTLSCIVTMPVIVALYQL